MAPPLRTRLLPSLAATLAVAVPGAAQEGAWSPEFDVPGLGGRAFDLVVHDDDLVAVGEYFDGADGAELRHVARWDGAGWRDVGGGTDDLVRAAVVFDGDLVVGGEFTSAGGVAARGVARWDGAAWSPLGAGLQPIGVGAPQVFDLAVYDGELYAAGYFTVPGTTTRGVARWDGAAWQPVGGGVQGSFEPQAHALHVHDGTLVVGGTFDSAGGVPAQNVARWDGASWSPMGGLGAWFDSVWAFAHHGGELYAGGSMPGRVARWTGASWATVPGLPTPGVAVYALASFGGELYAGGHFYDVFGDIQYAARFDGATWSGLGGMTSSYVTPSGVGVLSLFVHDGRLVVGGEFSQLGDVGVGTSLVSTNVATWDGAAWGPLGHGLGANADVYDLVRWKGGVVAVGRFTEAGSAATSEVALLDGADWSHLGAFDHIVRSAVVFEGDLVVGGEFQKVDGIGARHVARYDGTAWSAMPGLPLGFGSEDLEVLDGELYAGGLGGVRRWTGSTWTTVGSLSGYVEDLQAHAGLLYAGGSTTLGNLAVWDGATMTSVGGGTNGAVRALGTWQGDLLVGGDFTVAGGAAAARVAVWDGSGFAQLGPGLPASPQAFAVLGGELCVAGTFNAMMGGPAGVARWTGSAFETLGGGVNAAAYALLADEAAGSLWVGGGFREAGGMPAWNVARWDTQAVWTTLGGGTPGVAGEPVLAGTGVPAPGETVELAVSGAAPGAPGFLVVGLSSLDLPLFGATLVPALDALVPWTTDAAGAATWTHTLASALPAGTAVLAQAWLVDAAAVQGVAASDAVTTTAP